MRMQEGQKRQDLSLLGFGDKSRIDGEREDADAREL